VIFIGTSPWRGRRIKSQSSRPGQAYYAAAMIRAAALMALAVMVVATPALAQSTGSEPPAPAGFPLPIEPGLAAEAGKPQPFSTAPAAPPATGCAAALDCRLRVIGAVQHNGAVELNAAVLKW
jgi:hypothetical protein